MIKTWYEEYEKIKDKAVVVYGYEWESMADEQKERILAEKNRDNERRQRICLQTLSNYRKRKQSVRP